MRSAVAPRMSAKVMIANESWKRKNTDSGTVGAEGWAPTLGPIRPSDNTWLKSPIHGVPGVNASE
jgi:hypothetical protein